MAAPVTGFVQLPLDQGNLGKLVRIDRRQSSPSEDARHHFVVVSPREKVGIYHAASTVRSITQTLGTRIAILENPVGSAVKVAVRRIEIHYGAAAATTAVTSGTVGVGVVSFTGTASGTIFAPAKRDTNDATNVANFRADATGLTVTPFDVIYPDAWIISTPLIMTAVGAMDGPRREIEPNREDAQFQLLAGEGLDIVQRTAGTASDPRRLVVNIAWEEFE